MKSVPCYCLQLCEETSSLRLVYLDFSSYSVFLLQVSYLSFRILLGSSQPLSRCNCNVGVTCPDVILKERGPKQWRRGQNKLTTCEPEGNLHSSFRRLHMLERTNSNRRYKQHTSVFTWNQGLFCMYTVMAQWNGEDNKSYFQNKYIKQISVHQS